MNFSYLYVLYEKKSSSNQHLEVYQQISQTQHKNLICNSHCKIIVLSLSSNFTVFLSKLKTNPNTNRHTKLNHVIFLN